MMKLWKYILPLMAVVVFASCSSKDEAEVIPRNKLADIYAEMFILDQWISETPGMRLIADTSLVYQPILEKYGYDKLDYIHSVHFYMNDPERFSRILRISMDKLDKRIDYLQKLQKEQELKAEAAKKLERFKQDYSFEEYFPYLADEPYVHYYDSLAFETDSSNAYRLVAIETADTLYDRLVMISPADSLSVYDTVSVSDTISAKDTMPKSDPLVKPRLGMMDVKVTNPDSIRTMVQKRKMQRPIAKGTAGDNAELNTSKELWQQSR